MAFWLFKSEPETWSWAAQRARGARGEPWTGVRNHQAAGNMKKMRRGDHGFFYHSGAERRIVGVVEVIGEYAPDPTDEKGKFGMVKVKAVADMPRPVSLAGIRAHPGLADMVLVKNSRLSVQPVTPAQWRTIARMGGLNG